MGAKIKCLKCGDVIQSRYRHGLVPCKCGAIFIDGGDDYTRIGGNRYEFVKETKRRKK